MLVVLAHGKAKETVLRHLPIWKSITEDVMITSPMDDRLAIPGEDCRFFGKSARYDRETNIRTLWAMQQGALANPKHLIFCEYDALLWRWPEVKAGQWDVMASKFTSADPKFKGSFYLHSPIIFGRSGYLRTIEAMKNLPLDAEYGFGDRYFGLAVETAKVNVLDGHALGLSYSQNEIAGVFVDQCADAVANGACFTHGVKEHFVLTRILTRANFAY